MMSKFNRLMEALDRPLHVIEVLIALVAVASFIDIALPSESQEVFTLVPVLYTALMFPIFAQIIAFFHPHKLWNRVVRRVATFSTFLVYLFTAFFRALEFGVDRPVWITSLAVALISAIIYLHLGRGNHGPNSER